MNPSIQKALNDQIREEFYSAYLYLSMATYFASKGLNGISGWMKEQASEETKHAMKFYEYVFERGGRVTLDALAQPPAEFETFQKAFEAALAHEQFITGRIHALHELAGKEKDLATQSMLKWFIDEQVEEEQQVQEILDQFQYIPNEKAPAILMLDHRLGKRGKA
jgi:ferritin